MKRTIKIICLLTLLILLVACYKNDVLYNAEPTAEIETKQASDEEITMQDTTNNESDLPQSEEMVPLYKESLSEEEISAAKEIAENYYKNSPYNGVESISIAPNDSDLYDILYVEQYKQPGNIIIFMVLTKMDIERGNSERSIWMGRESKEVEWKVLTDGF